MKVASGGGYSLSFAVRRQPTISFQYRKVQPVQLRQESSSSSSSSPSSPRASSSEEAESSSSSKLTTPPSNQRSFTSASASCSSSSSSSAAAAGASIPTIPERTFRQILKSSLVGRLADGYGRAQDRRPYLTQFLSTLVIYLCGDLAAQLLVSGDSHQDEDHEDNEGQSLSTGTTSYDPLRTLRHLTVGAVASVPVYKWFMFLHNNFNFSSRPLSIAAKVIISQCCFTPIFNTYFFSTQSLLAGASLEDTWDRLKVALPTSVVNSLKLWPAVTAFMFAYVDPRFRGVFAGAITVGWQTYLSWLNQKAAREVRELEHGVVETARAGQQVLQSTTS